jgi:hypothetical protein
VTIPAAPPRRHAGAVFGAVLGFLLVVAALVVPVRTAVWGAPGPTIEATSGRGDLTTVDEAAAAPAPQYAERRDVRAHDPVLPVATLVLGGLVLAAVVPRARVRRAAAATAAHWVRFRAPPGGVVPALHR